VTRIARKQAELDKLSDKTSTVALDLKATIVKYTASKVKAEEERDIAAATYADFNRRDAKEQVATRNAEVSQIKA